MNKNFCLLITCFLLSYCSFTDKYPDYNKTGTGIYYKLHKIGEKVKRAKPGDYVTVDLEYRTLKDSLFFKGRRKFPIDTPEYHACIDECLEMLSVGDSATFIIDAYKFFHRTLNTDLPGFLDSGTDMKITVCLIDVQTKEEFEKEKKEFLKWIEDFAEYERIVLQNFIEQQKIDIAPTSSGMYYLVLKQGTGPKVHIGDTVTLHYEGYFLNGHFFDSTRRRHQAFEFIYGQEWQVIEGLEQAVGMMREGEKSLFILPSKLAFGKLGSSTGIVPPYTSVIYVVELLKVK